MPVSKNKQTLKEMTTTNAVAEAVEAWMAQYTARADDPDFTDAQFELWVFLSTARLHHEVRGYVVKKK